MVVRISTGSSMRGALSYNERKVSQQKAELLLAVGFSCQVSELGFSQKLRRFSSLTERRPKIKTNTLHVSVNFPPDEIISDEKMQEIARDYMERIGFGNQPFLVYKHTDTHHRHFHIVTTNIQANGKVISFHNLGREKSEPARKAMEQQFGLIQAESRKKTGIESEELWPANYGLEETKHAITNIVGKVMHSYKFCNLAEFNIILRHFNIVADGGLPGSWRDQKGGLVYSFLNKAGYKIGQGIKASAIYGHPTRKKLEEKFPANSVKKAGLRSHVLQTVQVALARSETARKFAEILQKRNVRMHVDQDRLGIIRTVYFVDHRSKAVYSHQELNISLNEIYRLRAAGPKKTALLPKNRSPTKTPVTNAGNTGWNLFFATQSTQGLMHVLLRTEMGPSGPGPELPKKKKKKRKGPQL
jgi:hypothetical protein